MNNNAKFDEIVEQAKQQIDILLGDNSVPKNVKSALDLAKKSLQKQEDSYTVRASTAIYQIDEVSNDVNLPPYARTVIWNLLSLLESIKE
ncbi:MAG: UPF0147 family protein [Candidatus Micrarchaeaceae archaeon]